MSAIVTGGAGIHYSHLCVVPLSRDPTGGVVASNAVGSTNPYVRGFLAAGGRAVVTGRAIGGCGKGTVIHSRTNPRGGGLVTRLAVASDAIVNRSRSFSG
jgi:hypothetical protein